MNCKHGGGGQLNVISNKSNLDTICILKTKLVDICHYGTTHFDKVTEKMKTPLTFSEQLNRTEEASKNYYVVLYIHTSPNLDSQ